MENQQSASSAPGAVDIAPLSLPTGGGAIAGMGVTPGDAGAEGVVGFSIPLPVSAGRPGATLAPPAAIGYSSGAGNGVFGLGWQLPLMKIVRRTRCGVPLFNDAADDEADQYIGPDGEVLVPQRDALGQVVTEWRAQYRDVTFAHPYRVGQYLPRVEGAFSCIERWWRDDDPASVFWLIQDAAGNVHCLGKTAAGRVAKPGDMTAAGDPKIGEWLLEESLSPTGEHIVYAYQAEDGAGMAADDTHPVGALPHLTDVYYGNVTPASNLYLWASDSLTCATFGVQWLFKLTFDYGARSLDTGTPPEAEIGPDSHWLARLDPFSHFGYGYEVRCHRLCRQVIMFHQNFVELNDGKPTAVARLMLDYDENPFVSRLTGARLWAYDLDGAPDSQPPLMLDYTPFNAAPEATRWQPWGGLPGLDNGQPFQMVDLFGDGIAGLLYHAGNGWLYREPQRDPAGPVGEDRVAYGPWQTLPQLPGMLTGNAMLMDINGDARLDWVVAQPGMTGCFTLNPDKSWSGFVPFSALPTEFFRLRMLLADLTGAGLPDLALIGPNSVRLFSKQRSGARDGWERAVEVDRAQYDNLSDLPVIGQDDGSLIAFSDLFGSGTQHLVQIRNDGVWCWPNLGRGRFGKKRCIPLDSADAAAGFDSAERFNPQQLYLADFDGSGVTDLIYARSNAIDIYFNRAGNGFAPKVVLPLPNGVRFDGSCQLTLSDLDGRGVTSLVLTVTHPEVTHWRYDFCTDKPYLLSAIDNNMGAHSRLYYRSSAQYWLDDKQGGVTSASLLPFPIQTLSGVDVDDEIQLRQQRLRYAYHYGVYDGAEREFRGFRLVEAFDGAQDASGQAAASTPTAHTRTWYHSGMEGDEFNLPGQPWSGDPDAPPTLATVLTQWSETAGEDVPLSDATPEQQWWLYRALSKSVLRQEVYGQDDSPQADRPYQVSTTRYQVRLVQAGAQKSAPVVLPSVLEQWNHHYERTASDPQTQQSVQLASNAYGQPTQSVEIRYPRRANTHRAVRAATLPANLPDSLEHSSYDPQQSVLYLVLSQQSYTHLTAPDRWRLGIPRQSRRDALRFDMPFGTAPLSFEDLSKPNGLLSAQHPRTYLGQQEVFYTEAEPASLPVLVDHIETAHLDQTQKAMLEQQMAVENAEDLFRQSGLEPRSKVLGPHGKTVDGLEGDDNTVYVAPTGFTTYDPANFYQAVAQQTSRLSGVTRIACNAYGLPVSVTDPVGNTSVIRQIDYRFLTPTRIEDINGNLHCVALDAFGRVVADWYGGSEHGHAGRVGFPNPLPTDYAPASVEQLIAQATVADASRLPMTVANRSAIDLFSWMGAGSRATLSATVGANALALLAAQRFIVPNDDASVYLTTYAHRWAAGEEGLPGLDQPSAAALRQLIISTPRLPPHGAVISADRYADPDYYDDHQPQRIAATVRYSNGAGQALQTATLDVPGQAYARQSDGELAGITQTGSATPRWVISGRIDVDHKGQPVRVYQPYFVNDWRYVTDQTRRAAEYADTYFYDALGRNTQVVTALGYLRRTTYTPWFIANEDENDTYQEQEAAL